MGFYDENTEVNALNLNPSTVPIAGVINYDGDPQNLPTNWKVCDGTSGTPDLRNLFIVGAGDSYALGATGGASSVTLTNAQIPGHTHGSGNRGNSNTGGHSHASGNYSTGSVGNHTHGSGNLNSGNTNINHSHPMNTGLGSGNHAHTHGGPTSTESVQGGAGSFHHFASAVHGHGSANSNPHSHNSSGNTGGANVNHSHSVSGNTSRCGSHRHSVSGNSSSSGSHSHSISGSSASSGGGGWHENRPPYYALYKIKRVA